MNLELEGAPQSHRKLTLSAKVAGIYLMLAGGAGIALLIIAPSLELLMQPIALRAGYYARELMLDIAFLVAGAAVLQRRPWGRPLGVAVIIISGYYGAFAMANAISRFKPSSDVLRFSFGIVGAWSTPWIYLLCRKPERPPQSQREDRFAGRCA